MYILECPFNKMLLINDIVDFNIKSGHTYLLRTLIQNSKMTCTKQYYNCITNPFDG